MEGYWRYIAYESLVSNTFCRMVSSKSFPMCMLPFQNHTDTPLLIFVLKTRPIAVSSTNIYRGALIKKKTSNYFFNASL